MDFDKIKINLVCFPKNQSILWSKWKVCDKISCLGFCHEPVNKFTLCLKNSRWCSNNESGVRMIYQPFLKCGPSVTIGISVLQSYRNVWISNKLTVMAVIDEDLENDNVEIMQEIFHPFGTTVLRITWICQQMLAICKHPPTTICQQMSVFFKGGRFALCKKCSLKKYTCWTLVSLSPLLATFLWKM